MDSSTLKTSEMPAAADIWHVLQIRNGVNEKLGTWRGTIPVIAMHLADRQQNNLGLRFVRADIREPGSPTGYQVHVDLGEAHDVPYADLLQRAQLRLQGTGVIVLPATVPGHRTVLLHDIVGERAALDAKRDAYDSLTPKQRCLLGLPATFAELG